MFDTSSKKALKSGIWYTASNFAVKGIGFVTMPIFARIMTKGDIGNFSNFTSWLTILSSIITLDLYASVTPAKFDFKEKLNSYISSNLLFGTFVTLCIFLISLPFKDYIIELLSFNDLEYYLLFIIPMLSPALHMFQIKSRLEYRYKVSVSLSLGSSLVSAVLAVICVITFSDKLLGRIVGSYAIQIFIYIVIYILYLVKYPSIKMDYCLYALKISIPLMLHVISAQLLSSSDRIMITKICGAEDNALYSVAYSCSMVVSILWTSMNTAWTPWAFEQMDKKRYAVLRKASRPYLLSFGLIVFGFLLFAPEILLIMGGKGYTSAVSVIPPVMVAFVFQFTYSLYVNIETYLKKQKYIAIGTTIAATLNILLNFIFIPLFGYVAAAYTTLIGYIVIFFIHYYFVRRLGKCDWYDSRFNFIFISVFLALMFIVQVLYQNTILRYSTIGILVILLLLLIIWMRKEIMIFVRYRNPEFIYSKFKQLKIKIHI